MLIVYMSNGVRVTMIRELNDENSDVVDKSFLSTIIMRCRPIRLALHRQFVTKAFFAFFRSF